jgi:hypothetical protein
VLVIVLESRNEREEGDLQEERIGEGRREKWWWKVWGGWV